VNSGSVESSTRLQQTLAVLQAAGARGVTTLEIERVTDSRAVHSDVAALRAKPNSYVISCKYDHLTETKRRVYRYTLITPAGHDERLHPVTETPLEDPR
jgi:hypothetical protein